MFNGRPPLSGGSTPLVFVMTLLVAGLLSPVVEEVFFRGMLQRALAPTLAAVGEITAGITAVLLGVAGFLALHLAAWGSVVPPAGVLAVVAIGLVCGVLALALRSTPAAASAHVVFNLLGILV